MRADYEKVLHTMVSSDAQEGVIDDFLSDAGIHPASNRGIELHKQIAKELAPGKPLADLAGRRVWPDVRARKPEAWAKDRGFSARLPRTKPVGFLHSFLQGMLTISEKLPTGSPRRLPDEVAEVMRQCFDVELTESDAAKVRDLVLTLSSHARELQMVVGVHEQTAQSAKTTDALVQRLLRHEPPEESSRIVN